jgi:hypothetical protein
MRLDIGVHRDSDQQVQRGISTRALANWFSGVNRDRPKAYLGMGAELGVGDDSAGRSPLARHVLCARGATHWNGAVA